MKTNENAPVAANDKGQESLIPIRQFYNTIDYGCCQYPVDPVIPELIEMAYRAVELYKLGIIWIDGSRKPRIQMDKTFFDRFSFGEYDTERHSEYDIYFTVVGGVEFFCLTEKGGVSQ